ncbi:MAG: cytidylate kinase-like family protein [Oscillospiraceae bacterium]|nr:cytidylate kinase-like family protein [Oscillospiraceae bacterium]
MKQDTIITIRREFGANGTLVAKKLAAELGIPFYDNDIMADMMPSHEKADYFKHSGETEAPDSSYGGILFFENVDGVRYRSRNSVMFEEQSALTRQLADQGPAVFTSRCADDVLADREGLVKVFIGASFDTRVHNIREREQIDEKAARSMVKDIDKGRKTYYHFFTDKTWGKREDYDLCIDASKLDIDGMVAVIRAFVESRK